MDFQGRKHLQTLSACMSLFGIFVLIYSCTRTELKTPISITVEPLEGKQGEEVTLIIRGRGVDFVSHKLEVKFTSGEGGLYLGRLYYDSNSRARVKLAISSDANPGINHRLELHYRGEVFSFKFRVIEVVAEPYAYFKREEIPAKYTREKYGDPYNPLILELIGVRTHFQDNRLIVSFPEDAGVYLDEVDVIDMETAILKVFTSENSKVGEYVASISTRLETVGAKFRVTPYNPPIMEVQPDTIVQGERQEEVLTVSNIQISSDFTLDFPFNSGLHPSGVEKTAEREIRFVLSADDDAPIGLTPVRLITAGQEVFTQLRVVPSSSVEPFIRIYPSGAPRGSSDVELQIQGHETNFGDSTRIEFEPSDGIRVKSFTVDSPTAALAIIEIDSEAECGVRQLRIATGEEAVRTSFKVFEPSSVSVSINPSKVERGQVGVEMALIFSGIDLLESGEAVDIVPLRASGIEVYSVSVASSSTVAFYVDVAEDAPIGPSALKVVVESRPLWVSISIVPQTDSQYFTVAPQYLYIPSSETVVSFHGVQTSWVEGEYNISFCDPSIEVNSFSISSQMSAQAVVSIPPWIKTKRCIVYIYSSANITSSWLVLVKKPFMSVAVMPDAVRAGCYNENLLVIGDETGFINGLTRAESIYGSSSYSMAVTDGIDVEGFTAYDFDYGILTISVPSITKPGSYSISFVTGAEEGFSFFEVLPPEVEYKIDLHPSFCVAGGSPSDVVSVHGTNVNFTAGETTVVIPTGDEIPPSLISVSPVPDIIDSENMNITVVASSDAAGISVPVVVKNYSIVAGRFLSFTASEGDPYPISAHWYLRKGELNHVVVEAGGGLDFTVNNPSISSEGESEGVVISNVDYSSNRIDFDVFLPSDYQGETLWIGVTVDGCCLWRMAFYCFKAIPGGRILTPSQGISRGRANVSIDIELYNFPSEFDLSEAELIGVSGSSFVKEFNSTADGMISAIVDFAIESSGGTDVLFVEAGGVWEGAIPVVYDISSVDISMIGPGTTISGQIPDDGPRYIGVAFSADQMFYISVLSLDPLEGFGDVGYMIKDSTGIGDVYNSSWRYSFYRSESGSQFYLSIGQEKDYGREYLAEVGIPRWDIVEEIEPNSHFSLAQGVDAEMPGGVVAGEIAGGFDEDYYIAWIGSGMCVEVVSTRMAPHLFDYPFLAMELYDDSEVFIDGCKGSPFGEGFDPIGCVSEGARYFIKLKGESATEGDYFMFFRTPVVINEFVVGLTSSNFVELHCGSFSGCENLNLGIYDPESGGLIDSVDVISTSGGQYICIDETQMSQLAFIIPPFSLKVCDGLGLCDSVQVGGLEGDFSEGAPIPGGPVPISWQRLYHIDTDDNSKDFFPDRTPSCGAPNHRTDDWSFR